MGRASEAAQPAVMAGAGRAGQWGTCQVWAFAQGHWEPAGGVRAVQEEEREPSLSVLYLQPN